MARRIWSLAVPTVLLKNIALWRPLVNSKESGKELSLIDNYMSSNQHSRQTTKESTTAETSNSYTDSLS